MMTRRAPRRSLVVVRFGPPARIGMAILLVALTSRAQDAPRSETPKPLQVRGVLESDPNATILVHSWFPGEVVEYGRTKEADGTTRPLRVGDMVREKQLLAVVRSTERSVHLNDYVVALSGFMLQRESFLRLDSLYKQKAISASEQQQASNAAELAGSKLLSAERLLRLRDVSEEEIQALRDQSNALHKDYVEFLRDPRPREPFKNVERWSRVEVRSPRDGTILEAPYPIGDLVIEDNDIMTISDLGHLLAVAKLPETDLSRLKLPARWSLRLTAFPDEPPLTGAITLIGPKADPADHQLTLYGLIENRDGRLRPGLSFQATIEPEAR